MKVGTLEDLLQEIFGGSELEDLSAPEGSLCFCGSRQDAFDAALKLTRQMVENDCPIWSIQVASAMFLLSRAVSHGMGEGHKIADIVFAKMTETAIETKNSEATKELMALIAKDIS